VRSICVFVSMPAWALSAVAQTYSVNTVAGERKADFGGNGTRAEITIVEGVNHV
jgi:hypothetical protein